MRNLGALRRLTCAAVVCLLLLFRPNLADGQEPQRTFPISKQGDVLLEYYRFALLRYRGQIIAIHILPNPAEAERGGICYRWYHLTDGSDKFLKLENDNDETSLQPNPAVTTGAGETREEGGVGAVVAGPLRIEWSMGNRDHGWLYLSKVAAPIEFYPEQFDRIDNFSGKLDPDRWKRVK